jgi:phosphatidylserine/phosphatidylglycerophosphate/cardiolipin synthase-like enzyme
VERTLFQLINYLAQLSPKQGGRIAQELVALLNQALTEQRSELQLRNHWEPELSRIAKQLSVQPMTLAIPWQAYYAAHSPSVDRQQQIEQLTHKDSIEAILATVPLEYHNQFTFPQVVTASNEESVLQYLGALIQRADDELWLIAPYWSECGVEQIKRCCGKGELSAKKVSMLTPANMEAEHRNGVEAFKSWVFDNGSKVEHWQPTSVSNGYPPLVHAKIILADQSHGYVGSANISENGFSHSIEFGLGIRGPVVRHILMWIDSLKPYLEKN